MVTRESALQKLPAAWRKSSTTPTAVRLRFTSDDQPGIARLKRGSSFAYQDAKHRPVKKPATLARIRMLAIPPAWTDVWICAVENGHLQATGHDARGRKQYRYHPAWRVQRDGNKYAGLAKVVKVLPSLRRRVKRDLRERGMTRNKVLATVVRALESTLIRIGNDTYARSNGSYGLTTMKNRHARVRGSKVEFNFRGKSGVQHAIVCDDAQLAKLIRRCQDLPGRDLFGYG
jgi:DNA topoisomerase-1